jgi:hypothetical protein
MDEAEVVPVGLGDLLAATGHFGELLEGMAFLASARAAQAG